MEFILIIALVVAIIMVYTNLNSKINANALLIQQGTIFTTAVGTLAGLTSDQLTQAGLASAQGAPVAAATTASVNQP